MQRSGFDDPDLPLSVLFSEWPRLVRVFMDRGMLCPGCPIAPFHTITDACLEYDLNEDEFRADLIAARDDPREAD
ncbi:DUF1858 domain-containing protein [Primorskyibacter sp. 2E233]|uniref:DUF1858 domain-containing protein n=1 Tax=Primorskyibacter sp. 2E233 TaxID=3413431 RepID=UPI003BF07544